MSAPVEPLSFENLAAHNTPLPLGNTVLDIPLPARALVHLPGTVRASHREAIVVRYSAISTRPNEFVHKGYSLRSLLYGQPRRTRLLVSITISDTDDEKTVRKTINSIIRNVDRVGATSDSNARVSWREIVVLLAGSSSTMLSETSDLLRRLHIFTQPDPAPSSRGWAGEIYEYTAFLSPHSVTEDPTASPVPCQLIFFDSRISLAADEANVWTVRAFAETLKAEFWISVEVGGELNDTSFLTILREFQENPSCASIVGHKPGIPITPLPADHTAFFLACGKAPPAHEQVGQRAEDVMRAIGGPVRAYRLQL